MFCSNCGKEVNEQEKFCRHCGATVTNDSTESNISFDVILTNAGTNQVETIKVIREETGMSLKEAKEIVDNAPKTIKYNVTKEIAEDIKVKLAKVGAGAELQHSIKTSNNAESQTEVKTEEKPKKKKSKKKTILTVVVVLFLLIAIAGSDDNQSTNTTVATSTNAVETENKVAEQNQERTDEKESQQTETKDNSTTSTENTNKKNTNDNNSVGTTSTNKAKKENVINAAQSAVSKNLRSSSTARWGKTQIVDEDNYGRYMVYVDLEAQNGFGGYEKCYFLVIVFDVKDESYRTNTYGGIKQLEKLYTEPYTRYVTQYDKQNPTSEIKTFLDTNDWNVAK